MTMVPRPGAHVREDGRVEFGLWAPSARSVDVMLDGQPYPMTRGNDAMFAAVIGSARAGTRYAFRIDETAVVADPASAFQPDGVFGPSQVVEHAYGWRVPEWKGRPWAETVLMELHVGTFTPEGTYRAIIPRLDHIVETGVTAIELLPLADFAGKRNWGYDGVLWFAPTAAYGTPDDLRALIDAAHARGLMVFLDVVYNHFGPDGNFLNRYAPQFFTADHQTPWGAAIDYRVPQVRDFAIANALHWLEHYRFDGLRLDAVHAIVEPGEPHVLHDLSRAVGRFAEETGRHIHLVLENDDNVASLLDPVPSAPQGLYRAQWNDDYHHAWHVVLSGETGGYYGDYGDAPLSKIARALASGYVYQGEASAHRAGAPRGEPSGTLAPTAFVNFLQNHDQIGNRAFGERLSVLADAKAVDAALAVTLLAPSIPLLFMGEEWGADNPFPFFCDFEGDLAHAVRAGRRREFAAAFAGMDEAAIPDPLAPETAISATLDWSQPTREPYASRLRHVRSLLAARRRFIVPLLAHAERPASEADVSGPIVCAHWSWSNGATLRLVANLGAAPAPRPDRHREGQPIWGDEAAAEMPPWSVLWRLSGV